MPRAVDSVSSDMSGWSRVDTAPPAAVAHPPLAQMPTGLERSRVMLASLPGANSGPDAVQRQFRGGRAVPQGRLFVS